MAKRLTPALIESTRLIADAKKSSHGRVEIRDTSSRLILRVTANGARSYHTRPRFKGRSIRLTYGGQATSANYADAKSWADRQADLCANDIDPRIVAKQKAEEADARRFGNVVDLFLKRHAAKNRTAYETQRILDRYVLPCWDDRLITGITRRDVTTLLDAIEDKRIKGAKGKALGGPVQADRTLATIRKLFNWYATRDDNFISPVVQGMARTSPKALARDRILTDDEIRSMWPLLDGMGVFGAIVKMLFLTAQRRSEVANMQRSELCNDGIWIIPAERYKTGKANVVPLSDAAHEVIATQPVFHGCDLIFTTTGKNPFSGFSKAKRRLDGLMIDSLRQSAEENGDSVDDVVLPSWRLHDIRRTAKTLMMRSGVRPDISERVLGHVIAGVEGIYDQHSYVNEKRDALEMLAAVIELTVTRLAPEKHESAGEAAE